MPRRKKTVLVVLAAGALGVACGHRAPVAASRHSAQPSFTLLGQFSIPPLTYTPPGSRVRFGGISGLAATGVPGEFLGLTDEHTDARVYRLRVSGQGADFHVVPIDYIRLEASPRAPAQLDPESLALSSDGHMFVTSEGIGNIEPRLPPALLEFGSDGTFIRQLPVRDRFVPNATGPLVKGVRSNLGFESLTIAKGGGRLFSATETALAQDGEITDFEHGAPARILEYARKAGTFVPAREFVYMVEPIDRPPFAPGLAVNGLVELLALDDGSLLAMERSYVAEAGNTGRNVNHIRLFRIRLTGATDVSAVESLHERPKLVPVAKIPLLDLGHIEGLSRDLVPSLDNFEGLAFGPPLPGGRRTLLFVSDDNFNATQRTWFLLLAVDGDPSIQRIQ